MAICAFVLLGSQHTWRGLLFHMVVFPSQTGTSVVAANPGAVGEPNLPLPCFIEY